MESLKEVFSIYGKAVLSLGSAGVTLAYNISKFNQEMRPNHPPTDLFLNSQANFVREVG
jgi:hypothetical protein